MQTLSDGIILYHGSYCEVSAPDLDKCVAKKDFGKGFYLTSSKKQAESFVRLSVKKAINAGIIGSEFSYGYVSAFRFSEKEHLLVKTYETANTQWLHCIAGHRKSGLFTDVVKELEQYDVIIGKIANDATNLTLTTYMVGAYGQVGSQAADDICIGMLLPERLQDQFCFRTQKALKCLDFVKGEKIWL